jgi:hypothetical protein
MTLHYFVEEHLQDVLPLDNRFRCHKDQVL